MAARDVFPPSLIIRKNKELILDDGTSGGCAKLVAHETGSGPAGKEIFGVQVLVAVKPEQAAMIVVGSGFDRSHHQCAACSAELGGSDAGLHPEFLNGIGRRENHNRIHER